MGYTVDPTTGKLTFNNGTSTTADFQKLSDRLEQITATSVATVADLELIEFPKDGMVRLTNDGPYIRVAGLWERLSDVDDTGWIEPDLVGWTVNTQAPAYRRRNGVVYHRGRGNRASGSAAAYEIPVGFRPDETMVFGLDAGGTYTRSQVQASGLVGPVAAGAVVALSFDGIPPYPAASS